MGWFRVVEVVEVVRVVEKIGVLVLVLDLTCIVSTNTNHHETCI